MILEKKYLQPLPDINVKCNIYFVVHKVFYLVSNPESSRITFLYFINDFSNVVCAILSIPNMNIIVMKNEQVDFEVS